MADIALPRRAGGGSPQRRGATIDAGNVPQAQVGSPVTLWGEGLPIDEVAQAAGTIGYELMCAVAPRVAVAVRGDN